MFWGGGVSEESTGYSCVFLSAVPQLTERLYVSNKEMSNEYVVHRVLSARYEVVGFRWPRRRKIEFWNYVLHLCAAFGLWFVRWSRRWCKQRGQ